MLRLSVITCNYQKKMLFCINIHYVMHPFKLVINSFYVLKIMQCKKWLMKEICLCLTQNNQSFWEIICRAYWYALHKINLYSIFKIVRRFLCDIDCHIYNRVLMENRVMFSYTNFIQNICYCKISYIFK